MMFTIFGKFHCSKAKTMVSMITKIGLYFIISYSDKGEEVRLTLKFASDLAIFSEYDFSVNIIHIDLIIRT